MPSAIDWYRLLRSELEHEDALLTQRLNWFVMSQSFLFTAFAIVTANAERSAAARTAVPLALFIPVVALCTSVAIAISIAAGLLTMRRIRREFAARTSDGGDELPPLHGRGHLRALGMVAPTVLPLVFTAVWLALLIGVVR
ncbi:MAG TPA: hypothetical protein VN947_04720 [Polyangia bacterium]|nr:hypothetical protein [Polyangia bacterium]